MPDRKTGLSGGVSQAFRGMVRCVEVDIERGERIRAYREAAGLKQEDAAGRVGVSPRVYLGWEKHGRPIRRRNLVQLAAVLKVDVQEIDPDAPPVAAVDLPAATTDGALPEIRDQLETAVDRLTAIEAWVKQLEAAGQQRGALLAELAAAVQDLALQLSGGELAQRVEDAPPAQAPDATSN